MSRWLSAAGRLPLRGVTALRLKIDTFYLTAAAAAAAAHAQTDSRTSSSLVNHFSPAAQRADLQTDRWATMSFTAFYVRSLTKLNVSVYTTIYPVVF